MNSFELPQHLRNAFDPCAYYAALGLWARAGISVLQQTEVLGNQVAERVKQAVEYQAKLLQERTDRLSNIYLLASKAMREQLSHLADA